MKSKTVLRIRKPSPPVVREEVPNGIIAGDRVVLARNYDKYPDLSIDAVYRATYVARPGTTTSGKYEVYLSNSAQERCGIALAEDLQLV